MQKAETLLNSIREYKEVPDWKRIMATRRRKTLIVCRACHEAIHAGRPTRQNPSE